MTTLDLEPAARRLADLVAAVPDEQLGDPTPCPAYTVGDLVEHIGGLAMAFTAAATKRFDELPSGPGPSGDASRLEEGWRARISADLLALAKAWREPEAWTGMTQAGGVDLPGEIAGVVALDELVVHGWDLARSTGQPYDVDPGLLDAVRGFVASFDAPRGEGGLFGPAVPVPDEAPLLDRVVGMTGRDPAWASGAAAS